MNNGHIEFLSEQRRWAYRIDGTLVAITVEVAPERVDAGLLPYTGVYQVFSGGSLVDESHDFQRGGHGSFDEARESLLRAACAAIRKESEADIRNGHKSPRNGDVSA